MLAVGLAAWLTPPLPYLDDAYIVAHSADVLRQGHDAAFGVPALVGITSPPYLLLVWGLQAIGLDALLSLRVATAAGLSAFLLAVWILLRRRGLRDWQAMGLLAVLLLSGQTILGLTNGLETGVATALSVWLIAATEERERWTVAILSGLIPCLRPDLLPLVGVAWLRATWGLPWSRRLGTVGVAALAAAPFVLWIRADTGEWWPQTLAAKRVFFAEGCQPLFERLTFAGSLIADWATTTVPVAVGVLLALRSATGRWLVLATLAILLAYATTLPGGIAHNDSRYLTPLWLPLAVLGLSDALVTLPHDRTLGSVAPLGGILLVAAGLRHPPVFAEWNQFAQDVVSTAAWVDRETPADATLLVHDAGGLSVLAHRRLVDLVGLKSIGSIDAHAAYTWPSCGVQRAQAFAAIAASANARYLVVVDEWERIFGLAQALARRGWTLTRLREHPAGTRGYDVYRLQRTADASVPGRDAANTVAATVPGHNSSPSTSSSAAADTAAPRTNGNGR